MLNIFSVGRLGLAFVRHVGLPVLERVIEMHPKRNSFRTPSVGHWTTGDTDLDWFLNQMDQNSEQGDSLSGIISFALKQAIGLLHSAQRNEQDFKRVLQQLARTEGKINGIDQDLDRVLNQLLKELNDPKARASEGMRRSAETQYSNGEINPALHSLNLALDRSHSPTDFAAHRSRGYIYLLEKENYAQALNDFLEASVSALREAAAGPDAAKALRMAIAVECYLCAAIAAYSLNQIDKAMQICEEILKLDPDLQPAHYLRARCFARKGNDASAAKALKQAIIGAVGICPGQGGFAGDLSYYLLALEDPLLRALPQVKSLLQQMKQAIGQLKQRESIADRFEVITVDQQGQEIARSPKKTYPLREALDNQHWLEVVDIPGGEFLMGSPATEDQRESNEGPQHLVTIQPFWMGKYLVTQGQWRIVAGLPKVNRNLNPYPAKFEGKNRPVERITWHEAVEFCDRLTQKTGREHRLPSEAEWEYACRAGTTTPFHFGKTITSDLANYDADYTYAFAPTGEYQWQTTEVGRFPANAFGLYDMHGNVWEWCADYWHNTYDGAPIDGSAWITGGDETLRPLRGGSWDSIPRQCRSAFRYWLSVEHKTQFTGFRVVCSSV
jgi:formylglycine-generating enzyme required for sulfatase activity